MITAWLLALRLTFFKALIESNRIDYFIFPRTLALLIGFGLYPASEPFLGRCQVIYRPGPFIENLAEGAQSTVFELKVAKQDLGKIIGRQGRTADALRTILRAISAKENRRMSLEIIE